MADSYRKKFIDEKRSNSKAYAFQHLEPGGLEADIEGFKKTVRELLNKLDSTFLWLRDGEDLRFRVLAGMLALILSDDWGRV